MEPSVNILHDLWEPKRRPHLAEHVPDERARVQSQLTGATTSRAGERERERDGQQHGARSIFRKRKTRGGAGSEVRGRGGREQAAPIILAVRRRHAPAPVERRRAPRQAPFPFLSCRFAHVSAPLEPGRAEAVSLREQSTGWQPVAAQAAHGTATTYES